MIARVSAPVTVSRVSRGLRPRETQRKILQSVTVPLVPRGLRPGDGVLLSGEVFTLRDMSLAKLRSRPAAVPLEGAAVYFCAPTRGGGPCRRPISCGPTTSARMADGIPFLVRRGVKIFVGKGPLPPSAMRDISRAGGVYLTAVGGCGAYYSRFVKRFAVAAFPELGAEAVLKLSVSAMPLTVFPTPVSTKGFSKK